VIWNEKTFGVISLFGYDIGVFDLNAIESNDDPHRDLNTYKAIREQIRITKAPLLAQCHPPQDPPYKPPTTAIPDLTFSPDAAIIPHDGTADLSVYAVDASRGILDLTIHPPTTDAEAAAPSDGVACGERSEYGLVFQTSWIENNEIKKYYHPVIKKLRERFQAVSSPSRLPFGRFSAASYYHWTLEANDNKTQSFGLSGQPIGFRGSAAGTRVQRDYLLVPGNEYGLLVVEVGGTPPDPGSALNPSFSPLQNQHLVDVIWIPAGAYAARAIPRTNLASVIDGDGRVLLVDLSRIDERIVNGTLIAPDALFPTADKALSSAGSYGVGKEDPRIVWKSEPGLAAGTLPPWVDPDTGFLFLGKLLTPTTEVVSAIDPHIAL